MDDKYAQTNRISDYYCKECGCLKFKQTEIETRRSWVDLLTSLLMGCLMGTVMAVLFGEGMLIIMPLLFLGLVIFTWLYHMGTTNE